VDDIEESGSRLMIYDIIETLGALNHRCQVGKPRHDPLSDITTITTVATAHCFLYRNDQLGAFRGADVDVDAKKYTMLLPASFNPFVQAEDIIQQVKSLDNDLLLDQAEVKSIARYSSHDDGRLLFLQLDLELG
jgi:hypothetical protein